VEVLCRRGRFSGMLLRHEQTRERFRETPELP